ncbi:unnamed protein product [Amoebophrya sp. A25]|nr:unnamed protein product [Amoebophrya sp. A25]|eukprot:GSA25T00012959001.1
MSPQAERVRSSRTKGTSSLTSTKMSRQGLAALALAASATGLKMHLNPVPAKGKAKAGGAPPAVSDKASPTPAPGPAAGPPAAQRTITFTHGPDGKGPPANAKELARVMNEMCDPESVFDPMLAGLFPIDEPSKKALRTPAQMDQVLGKAADDFPSWDEVMYMLEDTKRSGEDNRDESAFTHKGADMYKNFENAMSPREALEADDTAPKAYRPERPSDPDFSVSSFPVIYYPFVSPTLKLGVNSVYDFDEKEWISKQKLPEKYGGGHDGPIVFKEKATGVDMREMCTQTNLNQMNTYVLDTRAAEREKWEKLSLEPRFLNDPAIGGSKAKAKAFLKQKFLEIDHTYVFKWTNGVPLTKYNILPAPPEVEKEAEEILTGKLVYAKNGQILRDVGQSRAMRLERINKEIVELREKNPSKVPKKNKKAKTAPTHDTMVKELRKMLIRKQRRAQELEGHMKTVTLVAVILSVVFGLVAAGFGFLLFRLLRSEKTASRCIFMSVYILGLAASVGLLILDVVVLVNASKNKNLLGTEQGILNHVNGREASEFAYGMGTLSADGSW